MGHPFRRKVDADMIGDTRPSWHLHRYLQGSANLFEENRLLKFAIAGLFGITAVLGTVVYTSNQNQRTVIVPFGAGGDLNAKGQGGYVRWIDTSGATASYYNSVYLSFQTTCFLPTTTSQGSGAAATYYINIMNTGSGAVGVQYSNQSQLN